MLRRLLRPNNSVRRTINAVAPIRCAPVAAVARRAFATSPAGPILSEKQKKFYDQNGYLVLHDFCSAPQLKSIQNAALRILDDFDATAHRSVFSTDHQNRTADEYFLESGDKIRCFFEANAFHPDGSLKADKKLSINKIGHAMHEIDPAFVAFQNAIPLRQLCSELGYTAAQLVQSMYIFKQPRIGGKVDAHQDSTFLFTEPASVTGFWFAVEDATLQNGCLWAFPGSHKAGVHTRFIRNPAKATDPNANATVFKPHPQTVAVIRALEQQHEAGARTTEATYNANDAQKVLQKYAVPLEVRAGAVVIIHGSLVHLSYDNTSPKSRHAYTLHAIESKNTAYPQENWLKKGARNFVDFKYKK